MILAILLAAQQVVGVLEFRDKVPVEHRMDAAYLSDQVRTAVKETLPQAKVITRENMLVLLQASGKKLEECEGECEVDTGRRIGADLVISGELLRFGTQYKLNMKLHDTRSGELISGSVASGATADRALRPAVEKLVASLRPETHQDQLSDQRAAARPVPEKEHPWRTVVFSIWGTLGYSSVTIEGPVTSGSTGGFAYGFGGQLFLHIAGPLYVGALADYSVFRAANGDRIGGVLVGGGARIDLGEIVLSGGGGYSDLSNGAGSGYGLLGAAEYRIFRVQLTWRHGTSIINLVSPVQQTAAVLAAQAGVSVTF